MYRIVYSQMKGYPSEEEILNTVNKVKKGNLLSRAKLMYWLKCCPVPETEEEFRLADLIFDSVCDIEFN